jgi:hypothetical protein
VPYQSFFSSKPQATGIPDPKSGKGYTSFFGNAVQATHNQGYTTDKPKQSEADSVRIATAAGQKLGSEAKARAEAPKSSLFSKAKTFIKDDIVKPTIATAQKSYNTVEAGRKGVFGLEVAGIQAATGHKAAAKQTITGTNASIDDQLNKGVGGKGGFLTAQQASSSGGGAKGLKENFVKPTLKAVSDVAPLVVPAGKAAKGASLLTKVVKGAAENAGVGAVSTAASQAADGHMNAKEIAKSAAASGAIGGIFPVLGTAANKLIPTKSARPNDELQSAIENAHNSGNTKLAKELEAQLPDQAMNPDAPAMTAERRAELIKKVQGDTSPKDIIAHQQAVDALEPNRAPQPGTVISPQVVPKPSEVKSTLVDSLKTHYTAAQDVTPAEKHAINYIKQDPQKVLSDYDVRVTKEFGSNNVVNTDEFKHVLPDFNSTKSASYHEPASALAKMKYDQLLADPATKHKPVLIMAGGSGAGKTSALRHLGVDFNDYAAIQDTTASKTSSAESRIKQALDSGRPVKVMYIHRDPITSFTHGVIPRGSTEGRIVPIDNHLVNHYGSHNAVHELDARYKDHPNVDIQAVDNNGGPGEAKLVTLDNIPKMRYNEEEARQLLRKEVDHAHQTKQITSEEHAVYHGNSQESATTKPEAQPVGSEPRRQPEPQRQKPVEQVPAASTPKAEAPHTTGNSRVYERLQAEHPELDGKVQYTPIRLQEEADKAAKLIETDKQKAYRVAMGIESSDEITSTATNIAMAEKALADGNDKLYAQLTKNRSLAQTRRGQEIVSEKGSVTDNSTSRYVKELIATRLDKLGKNYLQGVEVGNKTLGKGKSKGIAAIDREVAKAQKKLTARTIDIHDAQSILDKITC